MCSDSDEVASGANGADQTTKGPNLSTCSDAASPADVGHHGRDANARSPAASRWNHPLPHEVCGRPCISSAYPNCAKYKHCTSNVSTRMLMSDDVFPDLSIWTCSDGGDLHRWIWNDSDACDDVSVPSICSCSCFFCCCCYRASASSCRPHDRYRTSTLCRCWSDYRSPPA